jgi:hypothetical protein
MYWILGLQLVTIFWEMLGTLGGSAYLEEAGHWEYVFEVYIML